MTTATSIRNDAQQLTGADAAQGSRQALLQSRHDIYQGIHKGLRAWMADVLVRAGRVDYTDSDEVAELAGSVRALLHVLRHHLAMENQFVHRAMERAIPGSTQTIATEHVHHERAIALIENDLRGLEQAQALARAAAAQRLYRRLALFVAENFEHMNVEETEHNAVLWATHTDAEIAEIEQTIIAAHAPEDLVAVLRWMVPAMAAPERAAMFTGIRMNAPVEVFQMLLGVVRPCLSERDYAKLCAAIAPMS
jgi:hypothetical protein